MESRRDYRKLMNIKKRNKNYAKGIVLATLGLGVALANSTTTHAEENREWKANTSTTIKKGDTEYKILWGDTLSLISRDSGITMDTLATLNNILNQDLIYEGNIIVFGDGARAVVKDNQGNVIAETPLTEADKTGIKEVQNNNTATNNTTSTNVNNSSSSNNNGTTTNTNNSKGNNNTNGGVINTVKPVKPTENGNSGNTGGTTNPINPIKPVDPTNPVNPIEPIEKEFTITINHITEDGEVLSKETRKAKENTTVEAKSLDFTDRGYEVVGESTQTIKATQDSTITFTYKKIDDTKPEVEKVSVSIKHIADDGKVLSTETIKAEKDSIVKADAKDFTELGYVLNDEISKEVKAVEGATIQFNYRKIEAPTTNEDKFITKNVDVNGKDLGQNVDTTKFDKVSEDTKQTVETLENGNTITTHTTTIVWKAKDVYVPKHTESNETRVYDENGTYLGATVPNGYKEVSRSQGKDEVTTQANGDTHTIHVTNVIAKKDTPPATGGGRPTSNSELDLTFNGGTGVGNSGMTFGSKADAYDWGYDNNPNPNGSFFVWEVKMKTGEIRWTVDFN